MIRHYFIAALRNMAANKLVSAISIFGLAVGLAAAILASIVIRNQYSYDDFVPGHERLYYATLAILPFSGPGVHPIPGLDIPADGAWDESTPSGLGGYLEGFPGVADVTRLSLSEAIFTQGAVQSRERLYYADPNFFRVMPVPVLYGDLKAALARPDSAVISEATARKYFGQDNPIGHTLTLDRQHPLTIAAVIADLPLHATNLIAGIFVSGRAPFSSMSHDAGTSGFTRDGGTRSDMLTLALLKPGASVKSVERQGTALANSFIPPSLPARRALRLVPADRLHVEPALNKGVRSRLAIFGAIALVILILACFNFINLSTARVAHRGPEVGVRKSVGAGRFSLALQFLGESILQALLALCIGVAIVEWLLPAVNAFLESGAMLDYWRRPGLAAVLVTGAVIVGAMAGLYPALILSSFRPLAALKGLPPASGNRVRQGLAMLQFAALTVLLIGSAIMLLQNRFATREALRANIDRMLFVRMPACNQALEAQIRALPGVRGTACSGASLLPGFVFTPPVKSGNGTMVPLPLEPVNPGLLELYGLKPLAGRFFDSLHGDRLPSMPSPSLIARYVINLTAVRKLGLASPQNAIGKPITILTNSQAMGLPPDGRPPPALNGIVIGVVDDFGFQSSEQAVGPVAFSDGAAETDPNYSEPALLHIKLRGKGIPETLAAIDALWKKSGSADAIDRSFMDAYVQAQNITVLRQAQAFGMFAGVAAFLACLGLFGVSLSTTARRIKEIGVRKAMGAENRQIVALLLWQFAKPVLWANAIAWPVAWWLMRRWLSGFAYHVDLHWWLFPAAGVATLLIALLTVAGQSWVTARQRPVLALRTE